MSQEFINSLLDEMAKLTAANQALESQLQASKAATQALEAANQDLEPELQYILAANQALELQLQESADTKEKLEGQLLHQTEVSLCLRKKNLELLRDIKRLGDDKTMLQATQEIHKGIISDLKESLHEEQLEKNYFEKVSKNTAELYTIFEEHEPFIMQIVPVPMKIQSDYLQEFGSTTKC